MKNLADMKSFEKYLQEQGLSPRSIVVYLKIISLFLKEFPRFADLKTEEGSVENINSFMRKKMIDDEKKLYNARFAFRHLLIFMDIDEKAYKKIMKVKPVQSERKYILLSVEQMKQIIDRINDDKFRLMATIQFVTGSRAIGVIRMNKKNIYEHEDGITINFWEKGSKERTAFVPKPYSDELLEYSRKKNQDFIFLDGSSKKGIDGLIYNTYIYYYKTLRKVLEELGYKKELCLGTHNWKVNWVSDAYAATGKDLIATQRGIGHADPEQTARYIRRLGKETDSKSIINKIRK